MNKLNHIDQNQVESAARKALIAANPQYHSWTSADQEQFRATKNVRAEKKIRQVLLDCLTNTKSTMANVNKVWSEVSLSQLNMLNWANLLTSGIGEDFVILNEFMAEAKSLLDFDTLYDYDYDNYLFQEEAKQREINDYQKSDYYAYRHPSWIRLLIEDKFYYGTLLSLATHLIDEIDVAANEHIMHLIPHDYIDGKDNGKPEKGGFLWDIQIDAKGQEAQLDELKSRCYRYQHERWLVLSQQFCDWPPNVFTMDTDGNDDPHRLFIFSNSAALKQIRWRHFLSDCAPLQADFEKVATQNTIEVENAKAFLDQQHHDITLNFDPKVVKWQKKRKIILSAQAKQDIKKLDDELN